MTDYDIIVGWSDERVFQCDCGNTLGVDTETECKQCGAHYECEIQQVAPPIGEGETDE